MESTTTHLEERTSSGTALTAALAALVVGLGVVFVVEAGWNTSWYAAFKAVHVVCALIWIGGGMLLTVLGLRAERARDTAQIATIAQQAAFAGERIFAPAGLVVLAMGIGMTINGHLGFGHFWIVAGLVGYALTFATGIGVLSPLAKKISASIESNGPEAPETQALISRILLIARFDMAMLLIVVLDMALKPFA